MKSSIKLVTLSFIATFLFASCNEDYMNTYPTASTSTETIFQDTDAAKMAINGIARLMVSQYHGIQGFNGEGTIKYLHGEYMGEHFSRPRLTGWYTVMNGHFMDSNTSSYARYPWSYYYMLIGNANTFIANIDKAAGLEAERQFLKAQALTYRAFAYSQLINFYCYRWDDSNNGTTVEYPKNGLVLRTEENMNERDLPLSSSGEVYKLVYSDLEEAISLFTASGLKRDNVWEPNANVAHAVYARAAITRKDYATAASHAASARVGFPLMSNADYYAGFSEPNNEWIWGSYGGNDQTLHYYSFHSYMSYAADANIVRNYPISMSKKLYEKIADTDIRKGLFLNPADYGSYSSSTGVYSADGADAKAVRAKYPPMKSTHLITVCHSFKFFIGGSVGIGYINHFRSSEMILIEAEAKYFSGDEPGAQALLNALVRDSKRDEAYTCKATGTDLLAEIKFYRAIELWGEGFDWLDKKRWNEPLVRASFADGGNFATQMAVTLPVEYKNRWTYMTPLIESESNGGL
ncbi:hypothetical protein M2137_001414 [Parabacteroides sp. PFB2-10]|uniref:RagB/SusD family nutrient uptake outer membrane protein n=1 Tax=Parabacteroides sp. PFB2-10 TaxID=1742405 RepID=UPI002475F7D4|nr:RagB/SusD family nutrient uptake outer membrane protein [Parabacteroides sp. PFB2-10]MDH6312639.1 hypothetical protein [Parabacteroides sp. PFB2-10]